MKLREIIHRWCSSGIGVRKSVEELKWRFRKRRWEIMKLKYRKRGK